MGKVSVGVSFHSEGGDHYLYVSKPNSFICEVCDDIANWLGYVKAEGYLYIDNVVVHSDHAGDEKLVKETLHDSLRCQ